jgi:16S rRNA (guanine1207-N2)-methyltransferase
MTEEHEAVLAALFLPFESGLVSLAGQVLFLGARSGAALPAAASAWTCVQDFKPFADALARAGMAAQAESPRGRFERVLVLLPKQREQARALMARAWAARSESAVLVVAAANNSGARSAQADLEKLLGPVQSLSKHHCRVFWAGPEARVLDADLLAQWSVLDAPRPILEGRFRSRPGVFAWDRIDTASALLAASLPADLSGNAADLGAGYGFLSAELLARCPGVRSLDVFEADARALELARGNLSAAGIPCRFHWHDVAAGLTGRFDVIVSNPPFHQGRADDPDLGRAFIGAAAAALAPGGRLWLVANRHLPYEQALSQGFASLRQVALQDGFKVIEAVKA